MTISVVFPKLLLVQCQSFLAYKYYVRPKTLNTWVRWHRNSLHACCISIYPHQSSYCTVCRLVDTLYCGSAVVTQLQSINIQHLGAWRSSLLFGCNPIEGIKDHPAKPLINSSCPFLYVSTFTFVYMEVEFSFPLTYLWFAPTLTANTASWRLGWWSKFRRLCYIIIGVLFIGGDSATQEIYPCLFISKAAELPPSMIAYKYGSLVYLCSRSQSCVVCFAPQAEERKKKSPETRKWIHQKRATASLWLLLFLVAPPHAVVWRLRFKYCPPPPLPSPPPAQW